MQIQALASLYASGLVKAPRMVLLVLTCDSRPGILASQIARMAGISSSTTSMAVSALARDGLLERRYPFRDKRQVNVYLTAKGAQQGGAMMGALVAYQNVAAAATISDIV